MKYWVLTISSTHISNLPHTRFPSLDGGDIPTIPEWISRLVTEEKYGAVVLYPGLEMVSIPYMVWGSLIIRSLLLPFQSQWLPFSSWDSVCFLLAQTRLYTAYSVWQELSELSHLTQECPLLSHLSVNSCLLSRTSLKRHLERATPLTCLTKLHFLIQPLSHICTSPL